MSDPDKLTKQHDKLVHSDNVKVTSHVQREEGEWFVNTVMIEGVDVPFRYKRKKKYKDLTGARVNLTYYPDNLSVGGMEMEIMTVVRIRVT
ncbi:MAG: hypothetical protein RI563_06960 [Thiohalophilus sp.]|uniref:hypothetical protein n=1 Tax=Thiohalophilus sp. TaxID=3028392 RepID=UPI002870916A|nr:hypothetical protein [Thiohalophilus sp.]MDR9436603.1 hypothetical protein [Thiohalophilus sp.]